jgi:Zc3h12a-like Ribonuclease NYN domain/S1 RNA binding domain
VTKHIIVDGSNIATEGRTEPSLAQLDEAVTALMAEYKGAKVTVIVDATFGHRIAKKERAEFESAIANNELVAPPAGAVGRGDAFILAIADKANAAILSNDSYQEFHGKYKWLFDEGRLIGGKPVPLVGWVFVERLPVRGPTSRQSIRTGTVVKKQQTASPEASKPMPIPKSPPPSVRMKAQPATKQEPSKQEPEKRSKKRAKEKKALAKPAVMANDVVPYLEFVEKHPAGTKVKAVVQSYAANGVTVTIGNVAGYVPLRNMANPIPRSARDVFKIGDAVTLTVVGYTPARRSVDLGVPDVVAPLVAQATSKTAAKAPAKKSAPEKKAPADKKSAPAKKATPVKSPAKPVSAEAKKPAKKAPAKKSVVAKAPAKKAVAKKAPVKKVAAKKAPAKKTAVKKAVAKKK